LFTIAQPPLVRACSSYRLGNYFLFPMRYELQARTSSAFLFFSEIDNLQNFIFIQNQNFFKNKNFFLSEKLYIFANKLNYKIMAYSDFTLKELHSKFGLNNKVSPLFQKFEPIEPSDWLKTTLTTAAQLPIRSEKAKSETIVFPILLELRVRNNNFITFFSGDSLVADETSGLKGECDFIITKDTGTYDINFPIIQVVEAKKNDIDLGIPQCAARMVGAKVYNEKNDAKIAKIYGCVTTGEEWVFMKLENEIIIDKRKYFLNELGELLSVFQHIIDEYKTMIINA